MRSKENKLKESKILKNEKKQIDELQKELSSYLKVPVIKL